MGLLSPGFRLPGRVKLLYSLSSWGPKTLHPEPYTLRRASGKPSHVGIARGCGCSKIHCVRSRIYCKEDWRMLEKLLGSRLRAKVLGWFFTHPGERYFVRQLTGFTKRFTVRMDG